MRLCFGNNIFCLYFPAHCSHGMQPLDNGIFNLLKAKFESFAEELNSFTESSPLGKINFIRCLIRAREAVTDKTIRGAFRHTGVWPISRRKCLNRQEIGVDKPGEDNTAKSSAQNSEDEVPVAIDRKFILALVKDGTRQQRHDAKLVADELEDVRLELAMAKREILSFKAKDEVRNRTKKRKAMDKGKANPTAAFMAMGDIAATGQTVEALEELDEAIPKPKRAKTAAKTVKKKVVVVEDSRSSQDSDAGPDPDEYELPAEIQTSSGRQTKRSRRYDD